MNRKIKSVMLIGGGRISFYLTKLLLESGMSVKIIEQNLERCKQLAEALSGADIVHGDGTDRQVLEEEGIERTDAVVSLTGIDEENMVISIYARKQNVDKIITKINRESFADLMEGSGVHSIITPKKITADNIILYARAMKSAQDMEMQTLYRIVNNKAEAMEFVVNKNSEMTEKPLSEIRMKKNTLIGAIARGNSMFIPDGSSRIEIGDTVVVVTTERISTFADILE